MTTNTTGVSLATSSLLLFHIGEKDSGRQKEEDVGAKAREQLRLRARPLRAEMRERASDAAEGGRAARASPSSQERASEQPCQKRERRRSTSNFSAAKGAIENGRRDNLPKVIGKLGEIDPSAKRIAFAPIS